MARLKIPVIEGCSGCKLIYSEGLDCTGDKIFKCKATQNKVYLYNGFPDDCPLPDAPEIKV